MNDPCPSGAANVWPRASASQSVRPAAASVHVFVEEPQLGHALGRVEDLFVGPLRVEPAQLRQQRVDERAIAPLPHPFPRIVALHTRGTGERRRRHPWEREDDVAWRAPRRSTWSNGWGSKSGQLPRLIAA